MLAGLIIAVVVVGGLAYVLFSLKRGGEAEALGIHSPDAVGGDMVVVRSGQSDAEDTPDDNLVVSTPLLRDAARHSIAVAARTAVRRRRLALLAAAIVAAGIVAAAILTPIPLWWAFAAAVPLIAWVVGARASVRAGRRRSAARLAALDQGWDEPTQLITTDVAGQADTATEAATSTPGEMSVELSVPLSNLRSLLEPLPVTPATYISKPLLPRSVRTIDLSAPLATRLPAFPVSADYPQDALPLDGGRHTQPPSVADDDSDELPFAVGE